MGCYHGLTRERAIRKETSLVASFHGRRKCNFYLVLFCNLLTFIGSIYGEIVVPGTVSNFIYKGNSNRVAHIAHKQASRALDWCLFVPWTPRLKQKWKSQVAASWWLSLTDCVGTWTAWEGTEQCPYLSRASPCLHFPVCKRLAMIPTLFFRDSFFFFGKRFDPCCWKEPDTSSWLTQVPGMKAGCLRGPGCLLRGAESWCCWRCVTVWRVYILDCWSNICRPSLWLENWFY